jgi:hypothetical protein
VRFHPFALSKVGVVAIGSPVRQATSGYILFTDSSGNLAQQSASSSQLFWDNTNFRLGVGRNNPGHRIESTWTVTADDTSFQSAIRATFDYTPAGTSGATKAALAGDFDLRGSASATGVEAFAGSVTSRNTDATSTAIALRGLIRWFDAGVSSGVAVAARIWKFSTGTNTAVYGFRVEELFNTAGGTITNTYGVHIGDLTAGTQTNVPYGVYQLDTTMRNWYGGTFGIGAAADFVPGAQLDVRSGAAARIVQIVRGAASQTADLEQWQDSAANVLAKITAAGAFTCTTIDTGQGAVELAAGTYTPTLTNVANLDASTAYQCQYLRVGNIVTVSGKVDADPTAGATLTQLGISLPIASNLGAAEDCAGAGHGQVINEGTSIVGDAANNRAEMSWVPNNVANAGYFFTFTYEVI